MSQTLEKKCLICERDPYESASEIEQEAIADHEYAIITIGKYPNSKHFCPTTLTRCETEDDWEEMSESEMKIAQREYVVKDAKKWKIMLKEAETK